MAELAVHFVLVLIGMLMVFGLLIRIIDYWAEHKKEKLRIERIKHQIDNMKDADDDPEDDPPSRREVRLG